MSFDRLARHYRWMEAVLAGHRLQRARTTWLAQVGRPCRALLVGEGPGRFLTAALRALPTTRFVCIDASAGMLGAARRAVPPDMLPRVEFVHRAMPAWVPERGGFDLVATHFFLDCFPAEVLGSILESLAQAMRPEATWMVSDFALPARGPARWRAQAIHRLMYAFFRWTTRLPASSLVPPEPLMSQHGLIRVGLRELEWGLIRSSLWKRDRVDLRATSRRPHDRTQAG